MIRLFLISLNLSVCGMLNLMGQPSEAYDIYLLIGQSNMAGRATVTGAEKDTLNRVMLFKGEPDDVWEPAANPLNKYSTIRKDLSMQKLGPGYSFARLMAGSEPGKNLGLVVNARGGSSIDEWSPEGKFYNETIQRTREAMEYGRIKGILWHQGESDIATPDTYIDKLIVLIGSLRSDLGDPTIPVVIGEIFANTQQKKDFNQMLSDGVKRISNCTLVTSDGLRSGDRLHFDTESQLTLGQRYAEAMMALQAALK